MSMHNSLDFIEGKKQNVNVLILQLLIRPLVFLQMNCNDIADMYNHRFKTFSLSISLLSVDFVDS